MLRRRHHAQEEAARKTKGGQETHEADRHRRGTAGGLPGHLAGRRLIGGPATPLAPAARPTSFTRLVSPSMSALTAILYAALAIYLGGWYADQWIGNFSLLLFVLTVVTLGYWLAERFHFKPAREAAAAAVEAQQAQRRAELAGKGITQVDGDL